MIRAAQAPLPFAVRRGDWEGLVGGPHEVAADEWRQLSALSNTPRAEHQIGEEVRAHVVAVTCVRYVDRHEVWQTAWIIGARNRVLAPAATVCRRRMLRLMTWVASTTLLAMIFAGVAFAVANGVLG